jgi:hypothetical protein
VDGRETGGVEKVLGQHAAAQAGRIHRQAAGLDVRIDHGQALCVKPDGAGDSARSAR